MRNKTCLIHKESLKVFVAKLERGAVVVGWLETVNLDIVDGLFGIESTSSIAYSDKELSSPLAVQECGL